VRSRLHLRFGVPYILDRPRDPRTHRFFVLRERHASPMFNAISDAAPITKFMIPAQFRDGTKLFLSSPP
jgi:hypothetical protein